MERLLADAQELTGIEYDISNLSDVYSAIHVIQNEIGITGTTAKEAAETLSGSLASMKAAAQNVLGALTTGKGLSDALAALGETVRTFIFNNLIPMIKSLLESIPDVIDGLLPMITSALTSLAQNAGGIVEFATTLVSRIAEAIKKNFPTMFTMAIEAVVNFAKSLTDPKTITSLIESAETIIKTIVKGLLEALPALVEAAPQIIIGLTTGIIENLPAIYETAAQIIGKLIEGIADALPQLISSIPDIIGAIIKSIVATAPKFLESGKKLIKALLEGVTKTVGSLLEGFGEIGKKLIQKIKDWFAPIKDVGKNLIEGLWNGITDKINWLKDKLKNFCSTVLDTLKSFFGIHSPSKLMADEVGKWIPEGVAVGINSNIKPITNAMKGLGEATSGTFMDAMPSTSGYSVGRNSSDSMNDLMETYLPYLADQKSVTIVLEGDAKGLFNLVRRESNKFAASTGNVAFV